MKNITVLDTNAILCYLLKDNPEQFQQIQSLMTEVKTGCKTVYIPDSVLAACIYVLLKVYKIPKQEACQTLNHFLNYAGISYENKEILLNSLELFSQYKVDIVDAIVYSTAKYKNGSIFSFDKDLKKFSN